MKETFSPETREEKTYFSEKLTQEKLLENLHETGAEYTANDNSAWIALIGKTAQEVDFRSVYDSDDVLFDYDKYESPEKGFIVQTDEGDVLITPIARKGNIGSLGKQVRPDFYGWRVNSFDDDLKKKVSELSTNNTPLGKIQNIEESLIQNDRRKSNKSDASFTSVGRDESSAFDKIIFENGVVEFGIGTQKGADGTEPYLKLNLKKA